MAQHDDKSIPPAGTAWPGGWYVYENGKVDGPFSAEDTFRLSGETSEGKPRLVSRKGFSQWYALKDLSEIFRITDRMGRKVQQQAEITEAQIAEARAAVDLQTQQGPSTQGAKPRAQVERREIRVDSQAGMTVKPVTQGAVVEPMETAEAPAVTGMSAAPTSASEAFRSGRVTAPSVTKARTRALVMQEYFLARGRLRLGKLRNPWISGFIGVPLTLGVSWSLWMRDLAREVAHHTRNEDGFPAASPVLAMIPLVHMFMTYKLAKLVVAMEAQNRYRSVSPLVAAIFAIVPPFAMAYLQDAANRHWLLHVKHGMVKKRGVGE